ncbi:MAG: hypothetical protein WC179_08590 [Candidatus Cloacimonadaceae bacterium]
MRCPSGNAKYVDWAAKLRLGRRGIAAFRKRPTSFGQIYQILNEADSGAEVKAICRMYGIS